MYLAGDPPTFGILTGMSGKMGATDAYGGRIRGCPG